MGWEERNRQGWDRIQSPTSTWAPGLLKQKKGTTRRGPIRRDCFTDLQCVPVLPRCHWVSPGNKNRAPFIGYIKKNPQTNIKQKTQIIRKIKNNNKNKQNHIGSSSLYLIKFLLNLIKTIIIFPAIYWVPHFVLEIMQTFCN